MKNYLERWINYNVPSWLVAIPEVTSRQFDEDRPRDFEVIQRGIVHVLIQGLDQI